MSRHSTTKKYPETKKKDVVVDITPRHGCFGCTLLINDIDSWGDMPSRAIKPADFGDCEEGEYCELDRLGKYKILWRGPEKINVRVRGVI